MTRRQAWGLLLIAILFCCGRAIREHLLLASGDHWRDPLWLDSLLPPVPPAEEADPPPLVLAGRIDINHCSAETLQALPGIGPVLTERLLAARAAGVQFACPEDLQKVKGIGPKLAARLRDHLTWPAEIPLTDSPPTASAPGDSAP